MEHLTFKGIPIDGNASDFIRKMEAIGFSLKNSSENIFFMEGKFVNEKCEINVISTPVNKIVWKIMVYTAPVTNWYTLKERYLKFKEQYSRKYGPPTDVYEFFISPYEEGDGYEMTALHSDNCVYKSFWSLENGTLALVMSEEEKIYFAYEDKINANKFSEEEEIIIQDDI